jgi:hypothetical protein
LRASPELCISSPLFLTASCSTQLHLLQSNVTYNQLFSDILQFMHTHTKKGIMHEMWKHMIKIHKLLYEVPQKIQLRKFS